MGETGRDELRASSRLAELQKRIQQATKLIGELRESNYSLGGEVAELKRQVESLSTGDTTPAAVEDTSALQAEVAALRREREQIRTKVKKLLERIEKLES